MGTESYRRAVRLALVSLLGAAVAGSFVFWAVASASGTGTPEAAQVRAFLGLPWVVVATMVVAFFVGAAVARDSLRAGAWGSRTVLALSILAIACECGLFVLSGWGFTLD